MLSLEEFKELLQISDTTYDTVFATYEPIVASDVEGITNIIYNVSHTINLTEGATIATSEDKFYNEVFCGSVISGTGIPEGTAVSSWSEYSISMTKEATETGTVTAVINPLPDNLKLIVAKMVLFQIQRSTTTKALTKELKSKSIAGLSLSFSDATDLHPDYDYPKNLVQTLRRYRRLQIDIGDYV